MSLEDAINKFAQEARRILLEKTIKKADTTVVKSDNFDEDGNHVVKDLDRTRTVKALGRKYTPKNSKLILDDAGSVERRKSKRSAEVSRSKKISKKIAIATPKPNVLNREGVFFHLDEEIFEELGLSGWIYIYYSESNDYESRVYARGAVEGDIYGPASSSFTSTNTAVNSYPATYGTCYRISAAYAYAQASISVGPGGVYTLGTASAECSGAGVSASVEMVSTLSNQLPSGWDFDYAVEETSSSSAISAIGSNFLSYYGGTVGEAKASLLVHYIQFPNAKIYLHTLNGDTDYILTIDLNDYFSNPVYNFDLARCFSRIEQTEQGGSTTILFHSYSVITVDMSQEDYEQGTDFYGYADYYRYFGKVSKGILNLRTNLTTGVTQHNYTPQPDFDNTVTPDRGNVYGAWLVVSYHGSTGAHSLSSGTAGDYFDHPEALWKNSFSDDWMNAFSDIVWDSSAVDNITDYELSTFLSIAWTPPVWTYRLHDDAPETNTVRVWNYDPASLNQWEDGLPFYNNWRDIQELGGVVTDTDSVRTYPTDFPEIDEFVQQQIDISDYYNAGTPITRFVPNYNAVLDETTQLMDRIFGVYLSYPQLPAEPEEEEEEEDPNP